jgi:hypothetical protein
MEGQMKKQDKAEIQKYNFKCKFGTRCQYWEQCKGEHSCIYDLFLKEITK